MKLLHRHIFSSVVWTSLAAVGVLGFVLMLGNLLKDLMGLLLAGQIAPDTFLRLVWLLVPFVVSYALPMGVLTGVLLVLGRMSADREITAIRAAGVSVAGISAPIFFFALMGMTLSGAVNFYFMPTARLAYQRELADAVRVNPLSFIVPKTFIRDFPGRVIYVSEKSGENLKDFWIWELDGESRVKRLARAQSARVVFDEANNKLVLTLHHAQIEMRDEKDPENFTALRGAFSSEVAAFDLPLDRLTGRQSVNVKLKWKVLPELLADWEKLGRPDPKLSDDERWRQRIRIQTVIQEKASMAVSVLSFALLAIPLGIQVSRKETSANLGVALLLVMCYYVATVAAGMADNKPHFRPDLLIWLPNIAFQALGIWMFRKIDRN